MKWLAGILVVAAALWSAIWFVGAGGVKAGMGAWFEDRRDAGWQAEYADLSVNGFPNRFDTSFTDLRLADPNTGWAWEMPFFQILALSYRPNHIIAVWPQTQRLATPFERFDILSEDMRASLVVHPDSRLAIARSNLDIKGMVVEIAGAPFARIDGLRAAFHQQETPEEYHIALRGDGVVPPAMLRMHLDPEGILPPALSAVNLDMKVTFDRVWDIGALENARPQPTDIKLKLAEAEWGPVGLMMAGDLVVLPDGTPEGEIAIKAKNWRQLIALVRATGQVPEGIMNGVEEGATFAATLSGNPKSLDVTLKFRAGAMWLGPIPLARAPLIRLR